MLEENSVIFENSVNLKQVAYRKVWFTAFLRADIHSGGEVEYPVHKTAVFYRFAKAVHLIKVNACFMYGENTVLFGVIFSYVLKQPVPVIGGFRSVVADKPEVFSVYSVNKCIVVCLFIFFFKTE